MRRYRKLPLAPHANPKVPANTAAELVALARREPGKLTYSSAGIGSGNHLAGALFVDAASIALTHVPYIEANIRGASIGHLAGTGSHTGGGRIVP